MSDGPDVLIIGAGLAGLCCGKRLAECGVRFRILDAADAVGGRVRTDLVDGFRLDRGLQLYLTAFPEGRRALDLAALDLRPLARGAKVWANGRFRRVPDPLGSPLDTLRLVRLYWNIDRGADERLTLDLLRWNGRFPPRTIDRLFRPLAGVFARDNSLAVSSRFFRFLFRTFADGFPAVPALGMQAIPDQLAANLPPNSVRLGAVVERIRHREVTLKTGEVLRARAVVVATEGPAAAWLLGGEIPDPGSRGDTTLHYAADRPPTREAILMLDGEGGGPVNCAVVLSNAAPSYAPPGKALVTASVVGVPADDDAELDRRARAQLRRWFGTDVMAWRLLRVYRTPHAVPDQTAGKLDPWQRPVRVRPGLYVCGDHRDNGTMDGAMTSGFRAAQAAMEDLHAELT